MKIGILTFHWATNYGAILQAYCLQEYLTELGHDVSIINYKPKKYDFSWIKFIKHPGLLKTIGRQLTKQRKEELLIPFRTKYLKTTKRYSSTAEFGKEIFDYDILISGSDQVLNPNITLYGDNGNVSSAYWLGIGREDAKRIGYAVSFGCERYPEDVLYIVSKWVNGFDAIGIRELTGLNILTRLGYHGRKETVPDPTILFGKKLFKSLGIDIPEHKDNYTCVYMLRQEVYIKGENILYIDDKHKPLTMEHWLQAITHAKQMITNSYHGMIMAILSHVPFAVLLDNEKDNDMNDRFYTLLTELGIKSRLAHTKEEALLILKESLDFENVEMYIDRYRQVGISFIHQNVSLHIA